MPPKLNIKKWQFCIRDYFSSILSYLKIAFGTQDYTIVNCSFAFGYSWDSIPLAKWINSTSTPCAQETHPIMSTLSALSTTNNSRHEIHDNSPQSYTWCIGRTGNDYFCYQNKTWVGLHIMKISYLWITEIKTIKLKQPSYRISFSPNNDNSKLRYLIELPSLVKAKESAEWYYDEWLRSTINC